MLPSRCHLIFSKESFTFVSSSHPLLSGFYLQKLHRLGSPVTSLCSFFFFFLFVPRNIYVFIYGWGGSWFLHTGFLSLWRAGGYSLLQCMGFSLWWLLLLQSTGSVVVTYRFICSKACGIFPNQGSNWCPLHCKVDSQPLYHQGSSTL